MFLYLFAIFLLLFIGNNVLYHLGIIPTNVITTLLPSFYLLCLILLKNKFRPIERSESKKEELILYGIIVLLLFIQIAMKASGFIGSFTNILLLPIMFSFLYPTNCDKIKVKTRNLLVSFYCINSLWSIGERIVGINIFPFTGSTDLNNIIYSLDGFRSTALQDHPLNNALCLSAIMVFILTSYNFSLNKKLLLFAIGFFAILCFNTRSSMILWAAMFLLFSIKYIFFEKGHDSLAKKLFFALFVTLSIPTILYFIFRLNLGGRLYSQELLDDSAMVRISSIELFLNTDFMSIIFGLSQEKIDLLMYKSKVLIIENFWIVYFLRYGLIGFTLLISGFYRLFKRIFKPYSMYQRVFCFGGFFLLASTNNSLAVYAQPLCVFILSAYSFSFTTLHKRKLTNRPWSQHL